MIAIKITCDSCGSDVTYTDNVVDYRIVLGSESIPNSNDSHTVTDMLIAPPIPDKKHFCCTACLKLWCIENLGLKSNEQDVAFAMLRTGCEPR